MAREVVGEERRAIREIEPIPGSVGITFSGQGVTRRSDVYSYHDQLSTIDAEVVRGNIALMEEASGLPLSKYVGDKDESVLGRTDVLQTIIHGLHLSAIDFLRPTLENDAKQTKKVAGHSGGEIAAMVAAGVLDPRDSAEVVAKRGQFMHEDARRTPSGLFFPMGVYRATTAQIIGATSDLLRRFQQTGSIEAFDEDVRTIFENAAQKEEMPLDELLQELEQRPIYITLSLANEPTVNVIGGRNGELMLAKAVAEKYGARRNMMVDAEGGFHSLVMELSQAKFGAFFRGVPLNQSRFPVALNDGSITRDPNRMVEVHDEKITSTVEWQTTVTEHMRDMKTVVKVGPGGTVPGVTATNGIPDYRQVSIIPYVTEQQSRN